MSKSIFFIFGTRAGGRLVSSGHVVTKSKQNGAGGRAPGRLHVVAATAGPRDLIEKLRATGLARAQVALDPWREAPEIWGGAETVLRENGVAMVSGMVGCVGEDYATLESIRLTGGVAPDGTWEENLRNFARRRRWRGGWG